MGLLKKVLEAGKESPRETKAKRDRKYNMVPHSNLVMFRIVLALFFFFAIVMSAYAPPKAPKLPEGFCENGDVTATTGECMCHWQHKDGCVGSRCEYQMGLAFYHYSCKDCRCVKEP